MTQIATRPTKLGNLLKSEFWPSHGYGRKSLTVAVTSTTEIGAVVKNDGDDTYSIVSAADVATNVTPVVENNADYTVILTVEGKSRTYTFTSDADATATEIVDGLAALIEADTDVNAIVSAANVSDVLEITGDVVTSFSVVAGTDNLSVDAPLEDMAIVIDDTIYEIAAGDLPGDFSVACLRGGPGASGGAIVVREQLKFGDALTTAQVDTVVGALEARGIFVATQV